jgi:hypothetical protein
MRSWQAGTNPIKVDALHEGRNDWCQVVVKLKRKQGLSSSSSSLPEIRGASLTSDVEIGKVQAHRGASLTDLRKLMTIYMSGCPEKFKFLVDSRIVPPAEEGDTRPLASIKDANSIGEIIIVRRQNKKAIKEKQRIIEMHNTQISKQKETFHRIAANRFNPVDPGQARFDPNQKSRKVAQYDPNQADLLDRMMWQVATMAEETAAAQEEKAAAVEGSAEGPMPVRDIAFDYDDGLEQHGWVVDGDVSAAAPGPGSDRFPGAVHNAMDRDLAGIAKSTLCIGCNRGLSARYELGTPYQTYRMQVAFYEPDADSAQTSQDDWICIGRQRQVGESRRPFYDFGLGISKTSPCYIYYDNSQKMHNTPHATSIPRTTGAHY